MYDLKNNDNFIKKSSMRLDDPSCCKHAFKLLKILVQKLLGRIGQSHNSNNNKDAAMVSALLNNIYRWLKNPNSKFYDPLLHRFVHRAMKATLMSLLKQWQKLGATVIHASFDSIIIDTGYFFISVTLYFFFFCLHFVFIITLH